MFDGSVWKILAAFFTPKRQSLKGGCYVKQDTTMARAIINLLLYDIPSYGYCKWHQWNQLWNNGHCWLVRVDILSNGSLYPNNWFPWTEFLYCPRTLNDEQPLLLNYGRRNKMCIWWQYLTAYMYRNKLILVYMYIFI